ncbi:MAG: hypothetical protein ACYDEN_11335 [Acidimicrobiales bacterium]
MSSQPTWQREAAKTRAPRLPRLVVAPDAVCGGCGDPRTSHNPLIIRGSCRAPGCDCACFDPPCGCDHLLSDHEWGTPPHPMACVFCDCKAFDAGGGQGRPAAVPRQLGLF